MTASVSPAAPGPGTPAWSPAAGTRAAGGPALDAPAAPGYDPRRTLPLRVEFIRQLRRRRTMVAFLILLVLPWILVGAFELGGPAQPGNGPPGLVDLATDGGLNFAAFSFFASTGFLLVVAVALFCGDTIASEARLVVAALPAGRAGAARPAAAPENDRRARLRGRRRGQLPGDVAAGGHRGVRLASAPSARHRDRAPLRHGAGADRESPSSTS